ncbi:MAG: type II toxin-antitoxin system HicB family antitoxin [Planctomycetota bacterium]
MKKYQEFDINYYQDEDGVFTAQVPAIRGCVASGRTLEEAYRNAIDALESCLEAREKVAAMRLRRPRYAGVNLYRRAVHA